MVRRIGRTSTVRTEPRWRTTHLAAATPLPAARPARSRVTRSGSWTPTARSTSTTPAADCWARWTAGSLLQHCRWWKASPPTAPTIWIVDAKSDKVYKYTGAAANAVRQPELPPAVSRLNSGNTSPKDIVTDGDILWVVNDSTTDKVFKYTISGIAGQGSWTITTSGGDQPHGDHDRSGQRQQHLDRRQRHRSRVSVQRCRDLSRTAAAMRPIDAFALAAGNTNPQGIADPPAPGSLLATETPVLLSLRRSSSPW